MIWRLPWAFRVLCGILATVLVIHSLLILRHGDVTQYPVQMPGVQIQIDGQQASHTDHGDFSTLPLPGFFRNHSADAKDCSSRRIEAEVQVQQSFHLTDDILDIAQSLDDHPMIKYSDEHMKLPHTERVLKTWARLAQSNVWLEREGVYLAVTRVIFYDKGVLHWPVMSFLRGQIYDRDWNEVKNYTIHYQGEPSTFPKTFSFPVAYKEGSAFYGPEDPRVIIEDGVTGAEPLIIFNMVSDVHTVMRKMYILHPFTGQLTTMHIEGQKPRTVEKNWMPFYHDPVPATKASSSGSSTSNSFWPQSKKRWPSRYVNFVYHFRPLQILRCHHLSGSCHFSYIQPEADGAPSLDVDGRINGGTNFVAIPGTLLDPGTTTMFTPPKSKKRSLLGFPRTRIGAGCKDKALYRPEMMVLTATDTPSSENTTYSIDYVSDSTQFADKAMEVSARDDPCGEGSILIPNSIARWEGPGRDGGRGDVLTLTFTVDDSTTQVIRLAELGPYVRKIVGKLAGADESLASVSAEDRQVDDGVVRCALLEAQEYALNVSAPSDGMDLRKAAKEREKVEKEGKEKEAKEKEIKEKEDKEEEAKEKEDSDGMRKQERS